MRRIGTCLSLLFLLSHSASAEVWTCRGADGSVVFQDSGGPGCRKIQADPEPPPAMPKGKPDTPSAQRLPAPVTTAPVSVLPPVVTIPQTKNAVLAHHAFPDAKRSVPSLLFSDISPSLKAKGFSIPNHGDIVLVEITVRHVPTG